MPWSRRFAAFALIPMAAGCTAQQAPLEVETAGPLPIATVMAKGETAAVGTTDADAADDPAIWRDPVNPANSLILGTDKKGGLYVYGLDGNVRDFYSAGMVNNVALTQDAAGRVIVAASDRNDRTAAKIALFTLDTVTAKLTALGKVAVGPGEAYGICTYQPASRSRSALATVVSVLKDGHILVTAIDTDLTSRTLREWRVPTQTEGCVVDAATRSLYVGEEDVGIWRFPLDRDAPGELIARVDGKRLLADVEGLAIAAGRQRYLVASSQGDNAYSVYRLPDHRYMGRFRIAAGRLGPTEETDGIELITGSFGPDYPAGIFVAQDGNNLPAQNFKLVSWADIKKALRLR